MGALMVASFGFVILMGLPILTYFYAKQKGRKAWNWFFIGIVLPGIATLILACLPDKIETESSENQNP